MITAAREQARRGGRCTAAFIEADFMEHPFDEASLDFACANTSLHHMDFGAALAKMARLLRPGGRLAVVGLRRHLLWRYSLTWEKPGS